MSDSSYDQAASQLDVIRDLVAALNCDYDRLEELRELRQSHATLAEGVDSLWEETYEEEPVELAELEKEAGDCENYDDAERAVLENALSVEVRSGWAPVGEVFEPEEYRIELCTGGPHVEIVGDLNIYGEPTTAQLFYQGWGTDRKEFHVTGVDAATLLVYVGVFYFGY